MTDAFDLERFVDAHRDTHERALAELRGSRKTSHWMWFVFPQLRGLGRSETARFYGIDGLPEARAFLAHPVLGSRLHAACDAVLSASGTASAILGPVDAQKLRSSMTLFARAAPTDPVFERVIERFYDGSPDPLTDELLRSEAADAP